MSLALTGTVPHPITESPIRKGALGEYRFIGGILNIIKKYVSYINTKSIYYYDVVKRCEGGSV